VGRHLLWAHEVVEQLSCFDLGLIDRGVPETN
jgi:hypothetical protein